MENNAPRWVEVKIIHQDGTSGGIAVGSQAGDGDTAIFDLPKIVVETIKPGDQLNVCDLPEVPLIETTEG